MSTDLPTAAQHAAVMDALQALAKLVEQTAPHLAALDAYPCGREVSELRSATATLSLNLPSALAAEEKNTPAFRLAVERQRLQTRADRFSREVFDSDQAVSRMRVGPKREAALAAAQRLREEWQKVLAELRQLPAAETPL